MKDIRSVILQGEIRRMMQTFIKDAEKFYSLYFKR